MSSLEAQKLYHDISYRLRRDEWLQSEWPAITFWGGLWLLGFTPLVMLLFVTWWSVLLFLAWNFLVGRKVLGIFWFVWKGKSDITLRIYEDGNIAIRENSTEFSYTYLEHFESQGNTFLLWGADGRFRVIIPRRVLTQSDYEAILCYTGNDLQTLEQLT